MKLTPILLAVLCGCCALSVQAAEPLRPLDPGALRVLGVSQAPSPAPRPAADPAAGQRLVPLRLDGVTPAGAGQASSPDSSVLPTPAAAAPLATSPVPANAAPEPTKLVPLSPSLLALETPPTSVTEGAVAPPAGPTPAPAVARAPTPTPALEAPTPPRPLATSAKRPATRAAAAPLELQPAAETPVQSVVAVDAAASPTREPKAAEAPAERWVATNGSTLKGTLQDWARRANWVVMWDDPRPDYEVIGTVATSGSFIDAVQNIFQIYNRSGAAYDVTLFAEQKLVLIRNSK